MLDICTLAMLLEDQEMVKHIDYSLLETFLSYLKFP